MGVPNWGADIIVPETAKYQDAINDFTKGEYIKMIVGDKPIDGGFEDFVEE